MSEKVEVSDYGIDQIRFHIQAVAAMIMFIGGVIQHPLVTVFCFDLGILMLLFAMKFHPEKCRVQVSQHVL